MNNCYSIFQDQVIELMRDIFSFEKCRYTTVEDLSNDMFEQFKVRAGNVSKMIEIKCSVNVKN